METTGIIGVITQNLYYNYYYPNPKYPSIGYMDPQGRLSVELFCSTGGLQTRSSWIAFIEVVPANGHL